MDELDHLEFLDFMNEQELKAETIEANSELAEDINPTAQIFMNAGAIIQNCPMILTINVWR